jgi:hypothetical protein
VQSAPGASLVTVGQLDNTIDCVGEETRGLSAATPSKK